VCVAASLWPPVSGLRGKQTRELDCEVCQTIAYHIDLRVKENLPEGSKKGERDVVVSDWVDGLRACEWGTWKEYAERADNLHIYDMVKACRRLLDDSGYQDGLEALLGQEVEHHKISQKLCPKMCKQQPLWPEDDEPMRRLTPSERNEVEGPKWLEENKQQEGIIVTESGLQYKVLHKGNGTIRPSENDTVKVHYNGTLTDGDVFDCSYDRGEPEEFQTTHVVKGWAEALQLMVVGDKWQLYIPSALGYEEWGQGDKIKGHEVLLFTVELLGIKGVTYDEGWVRTYPDGHVPPVYDEYNPPPLPGMRKELSMEDPALVPPAPTPDPVVDDGTDDDDDMGEGDEIDYERLVHEEL